MEMIEKRQMILKDPIANHMITRVGVTSSPFYLPSPLTTHLVLLTKMYLMPLQVRLPIFLFIED